jgi:hypothetical protein
VGGGASELITKYIEDNSLKMEFLHFPYIPIGSNIHFLHWRLLCLNMSAI